MALNQAKNRASRVLKSPFEKGGLREISGGYLKSPLPPLRKEG
jgi:hypothetical protein